jgi:1-deoxy-D-xylulose-5-phosphate reductoisomerase
MDFTKTIGLSFEPLDHGKFPAVSLGFHVVETGGTSGAVFNAANEIAVQRFLGGEIEWLDIHKTIDRVLSRHRVIANPTMDEIIDADAWARASAADG